MIIHKPSVKQQELILLYEHMARHGYDRADGAFISSAFNDMEVRAFRQPVQKLLKEFQIKTLLDYGCGGSNYHKKGFDNDLSAIEYFDLNEIYLYEPARDLDQRQKCDAVICFDVLEHIFISDIFGTLREIFSLSRSLVILNIACYPAQAILPNGENAHITIRPPYWWKGAIDSIAVEFPGISIQLWCSTSYGQVEALPIFRASNWLEEAGFKRDIVNNYQN